MAIITSSIGSAGGRDYSTLAAWAAALPANIVTSGNSYVGECYADSEFTSSSELCRLSGNTTDASHTITLTTAAGQSFRDNANVQTNALRYNASNGVGIRTTGDYFTIVVQDNNVFVSNLQIKNDIGYGCALYTEGSIVTVDDCITQSNSSTNRRTLICGSNSKFRNCLIIGTGGAAPVQDGRDIAGGATFYFCTLVAPSDATTPAEAVYTGYGSPSFENCAFFGCTAVYTHWGGGGTPTFTTCMTDVASPPSGVTGSKTYGNQFQNTTTASGDWREKSGADLRGAGTADSTNGATDIAGSARPQSGNWDIGCWELVASGTAVTADAWVLLELLANQRRDGVVLAEWLASQRRDPADPFEFVTAQRRDWLDPTEFMAAQRRDDFDVTEFVAGQRLDSFTAEEFLASQRRDPLGPIEWVGVQRRDDTDPTEWLAGDKIDQLDPQEWIVGQRIDPPGLVEFLAGQRRDPGVQVEWSGALGVVTDAFLPIELLTGVREDFAVLLESIVAQRRDVSPPVELLATSQSNSILPSESIAGQRLDGMTPLEFTVGGLRTDGPLPTEFVGGVRGDAVALAEFLVKALRDPAIQVEWTGELGTLVSKDATVLIEWLGSPVASPAMVVTARPRVRVTVARPRVRVTVAPRRG